MVAEQTGMGKTFNSIFLVLQFCGWGCALGALAAITNFCRVGEYDPLVTFYNSGPGAFVFKFLNLGANVYLSANGMTGSYATAYDCGMQYSWYWWVVALQMICILAGFMAQFSQSVNNGKLAILSMYSTATALWCIWAWAFVNEVYLYRNNLSGDNKISWGQAYAAAAAGAVTVLTSNFLFMFTYGTEGTVHHDEGKQPHVAVAQGA